MPEGAIGGRGATGAEEADQWSCGYRNVQMLVGHLLRRGGWSQLFGGAVPDVPSLQAELERLWAHGFDPQGREQMGGSVLGTRKWIGTSEACVLLRGQGVRCNIAAFRALPEGGAPEGGALSAAEAMVERAFRHFGASADGGRDPARDGRGPAVTSRPPLYLQHDGHSRTVVGVQRRHERGGGRTDFLLVLDPGLGEQGFAGFQAAARAGKGWESFVKRSVAPLRKKAEYELLIVEPEGAMPERAQALHVGFRV